MCFKIVTTDDRKEEVIHQNPVNTVDDEVSIIGVTKSNTPTNRPNLLIVQSSNQQLRTAANAQTFRASPPILGGMRAAIIRGNNNNAVNRELSRLLANKSHQNSAQQNHTNYANQMQYPMSAPPQRFHNAPHSQPLTSLANSMPTSQSIPQMQNNFMPQTGLLFSNQLYGSPKVHRGAVTTLTVRNQNVANVSVPTSIFNSLYTQTAPNVTIRPNQQMMHTIG